MDNINKDMARMVAEMREVGELPAPSKGGSHNNLLRYNEMRERIFEKFLSAFDAGYTLTPPNEWVSVEERLPEGNGEYIVTACDEGCPAGEGIWYDTVVVFAEYYDGCWTWNDGTEYDLTDIVTHWMPLPAPPDKGNNVLAKTPNEPLTCKGDENGEQ